MSLPPGLRSFLQQIGINTTRLQWKLYRLEEWWAKRRKDGFTPTSLRWMQYRHKVCTNCGAVADREAKVCHSCGRKLPSVLAYRLFRLVGLVAPGTAPVTVTCFMTVIVVVYLASILMQGPSAVMNPTIATLRIFGAFHPSAMASPLDAWRMMGFALMHIGIIHIGFNLLALSQVGPHIEQELGRSRMLVLITVTQLTAALATFFWYRQTPYGITAGASGWLFGLLGFGAAYYHQLGERGRVYRTFFVRWSIYALLFGFFIGANNAAHIGGMLGGAALAFVPTPHMRRPEWALFWRTAAAVSLIVWIVTIGFLAHSVFTGWLPGGVPR